MSEFSYTHYMQSAKYAAYLSRLGWGISQLESWYIYRKKLPLLKRSIIKIPRAPLRLDYEKISEIVKDNKPLFIKIEPHATESEKDTEYLRHNGYCFDHEPICQSKTILVDLRKSEAELLKSLRPETRHHLRRSWKQELKIGVQESNKTTTSKETLDKFYKLFEHCAKEKKFYSPFEIQMGNLWESFAGSSFIFLVFDNNYSKPLSGALILTHDNAAYYKYGASLPSGRDKYSSYFLFWEMFTWAKKRNLRFFDLEGIYDPRYKRTKKYHGFTQFKRGWSKNEVTYIGSFTKYYSHLYKFFS